MMRLNKNLPHEIVLEILKRLPVKPLMRFKSVSKSWRCMIDDPDFVTMHLKHSALSVTNWYVLLMDRYLCPDHMSSLYPEQSLTAASRLEVEVPFISRVANYSVVGSCNGLICVAEANTESGSQTIFLWNLFTRKYKALQSSIPDFVDTRMVLGFGYCDRINDYKVVRITYPYDKKYEGCLGGLESEVEVYSLSTDTWRKVEFDKGRELSDPSAVALNGRLHWISIVADEDSRWCCGSIITFGIADEVFNEIPPLNTCLVGVTYDRVYLAVLNSSLALLINHADRRGRWNNMCCVWVMTEYGLPDSWTKLHTLDLNVGILRFHGFTKSGELLIDTYHNELISWNPSVGPTQLLRVLEAFDLVMVVESLVSP